MIHQRKFIAAVKRLIIILLALSLIPCIGGCADDSADKPYSTPSAAPTDQPLPVLSPTPEAARPPEVQVTLSEYNFDDQNMFFGWSIIGKSKIPYVEELVMSWASLQPHVNWFEIEQEKGKYDWTRLDNEIMWLQELNVDITMVHSSFCNVYDEDIRESIREELIELLEQPDISSIEDAWITWNRDLKGPQKYGIIPDPYDDNDEILLAMLQFVEALTERYDGDGIDDWENLRYPVRIHHIGEEWPSPVMDVKTYLGFLAKLSPAIKNADPEAKIMIRGLLMPNWGRIYAYLDGYIEDEDAGIMKGIKYTKSELSNMDSITYGKKAYESILDLGRDYFDIVDIHLYTEKETFYEGEIDYVKGTMEKLGYQKPIWCVEGGGPFRNPESSPDDPQGDMAFGTTNEKEVAEYVVKFHAMSAAEGLIRQHWGIGGQAQQGYWGGPWNIMNLLEKGTEKKRPAYYTYKLMREKLRDFSIGDVTDSSIGSIRVFEFIIPEGKIYVAWNSQGSDNPVITDLSMVLGNREATVTGIVTELNNDDSPVIPDVEMYSSSAIPLSITPVFIE